MRKLHFKILLLIILLIPSFTYRFISINIEFKHWINLIKTSHEGEKKEVLRLEEESLLKKKKKIILCDKTKSSNVWT